jgi:hypothetical protein
LLLSDAKQIDDVKIERKTKYLNNAEMCFIFFKILYFSWVFLLLVRQMLKTQDHFYLKIIKTWLLPTLCCAKCSFPVLKLNKQNILDDIDGNVMTIFLFMLQPYTFPLVINFINTKRLVITNY